jgi:hypothetical protein
MDLTEEAYRQEVLRVLDAFLVTYPRDRNFLEDHPSLPSIIKDYYRQGIAPSNAGAQIGAIVISSEIARMDPNDRATVKKQLREFSDQEREQFRQIARGKVGEEISFPGGGIMVMTVIIAGAMAFARDALERRAIGPVTFEAVETEIFGALDGMRDAQIGQ